MYVLYYVYFTCFLTWMREKHVLESWRKAWLLGPCQHQVFGYDEMDVMIIRKALAKNWLKYPVNQLMVQEISG